MPLKSELIADLLSASVEDEDRFIVVPSLDLKRLRESGAASIDLRLGTWFLSLREASVPSLGARALAGGHVKRSSDRAEKYTSRAEERYVPFGQTYILQPGAFALAATLEWLRLPPTYSGYVVGKSTWGRCGLIIATATGVHPGFMGCLTLEMSNLGKVPINLTPGDEICQLFVHRVEGVEGKDKGKVDQSRAVGNRKPMLFPLEKDKFATMLALSLDDTLDK